MSIWGDTAPYNTRDSLILFLWSALSGVNQDRFWCTAFPKSSMCACGCHGKHTFDGVFEVLAWSFSSLLCGKYPGTRHDGSPFEKRMGDRNRGKSGDESLGVQGCCGKARGDWSWQNNAPICGIGLKVLRTSTRGSAGPAQRTVAACHTGTRPGKQNGELHPDSTMNPL